MRFRECRASCTCGFSVEGFSGRGNSSHLDKPIYLPSSHHSTEFLPIRSAARNLPVPNFERVIGLRGQPVLHIVGIVEYALCEKWRGGGMRDSSIAA